MNLLIRKVINLKKRNLFPLFLFAFIILFMATGYSFFSTSLSFQGTAEITGEWDILITDIEAISICEGCDAGIPSYTDTTMNFSAKLNKPGDSITYEITVQNNGNLDAVLNNTIFKEGKDSSEAISYETSPLAYELKAHENTTFTVQVKYNEDTIENPKEKTSTISGFIEYIQK